MENSKLIIKKSKNIGEARPRLIIFKSLKKIYAQVIDDEKGQTIVAALNDKDKAKELGEDVAKKLNQKGIKSVVFDRRQYKYHGKVKDTVESVRSGGIII